MRPVMQVGDRYGRLTVLALLPAAYRGGQTYARVRCDCGAVKNVRRGHVSNGKTQSCGCYRREVAGASPAMTASPATHGMSFAPEFRAWNNAIQRTTNPNHPRWKNYGARGIRMCDEWRESFDAFYAHIGPRPGPDYSLDRINNECHYEPGNVRWATFEQQRANQRNRNGEYLKAAA